MQPLSAEEIHAAIGRAVELEKQGLEIARAEYVKLLQQLEPQARADGLDKNTRWAIARAHACHAFLLLDLGGFHAALDAAETALRVCETAHIWSLVGMCHRALGDKPRARDAFRRSAERAPRAGAWVHLFAVTDDDAERFACLEQALALDPDYDEAHYNLGAQLSIRGELTLARRHLEKAVALDPNYAVAHAELGWALFGLARTLSEPEQRALQSTALTHLERALALDATLFWGRLYLAFALGELERLRAAKIQFETAVRLHPSQSLPHAFYGDFLGSRYGNVPLAEHHLRKAVKLGPKQSSAHFHLGKFLRRRGDYAEARRHLLLAEELGSTTARAVLEEQSDFLEDPDGS